MDGSCFFFVLGRIFDTIPETKFNCKDQKSGGYYADVDVGRCQVFHVCHDGRKFSFLCPNGTIFDQQVFVCNWWFNVDCAASAQYFGLNANIGVVPEKPPSSSSSTSNGGQRTTSVSKEPSAAASANINSAYLPPTTKSATPSTLYVPPPPPAPSIAPNAVEALNNGLIRTPSEPTLGYLPPARR